MAEPQTLSSKNSIVTDSTWLDADHDKASLDVLRGDIATSLARLSIAETQPFEPDAHVFSAEDQLGETELRNTKIYSNLLLRRKIDDTEAAAFRVFVQTFAFPLYRVTRYNSGALRSMNTIEQRLYETRRYLEGANGAAIQDEVAAPSDTTIGMSRVNTVQKGMHKWCDAEDQLRYFDDFKAGQPLPSVESLVPERVIAEGTRRTLASVAIEKEPKPIDTLKSLVGGLLRDTESDSEVVSILAHHLVGDQVDEQSSLFMRGSVALMWVTGLAARRSRHSRRNHEPLANDVSLRDYRLIERLTTENVTFREPWTIEEEIKDRLRQRPGCEATKEVVVRDAIVVLEKVLAITSLT